MLNNQHKLYSMTEVTTYLIILIKVDASIYANCEHENLQKNNEPARKFTNSSKYTKHVFLVKGKGKECRFI